MRRQRLYLSFLLCLLLTLSSLTGVVWSAPAAPLLLTKSGGRFPLTGHMEVLKDYTGTLTLQDVLAPQRSVEFKSIPGPLAAGFVHGGAVWLRFTVQRAVSASPDWILELNPATTERVQLYIPLPTGGFETRNGGSLLPFSQREIPYRLDLYRLTLPPDQPITFLIKIVSNRSVMALPVLWQPDQLQTATRHEAMFHGVYLGIILIIVISSLLYRIRLQEPLYGYYLCYVLCLTYEFLDVYGYTHEFIWTEHTWYLPVATRIVTLSLIPCNAGILSLMLDLPQLAPRLDLWFRRVCFGIAGTGTLLALSGLHTRIILPIQILLLSAIAVSFAISIRFFRQSAGARRYLTAFGILQLSGIKDISSNLGILPFIEPLKDVFIISSILHIMVLNFFIIGKLARMRKEKHATEAALLSEQQNVEQQRQFIRLLSHELRTPLAIIDGTAQILPLLRNDPASHDKKTTALHAATQRIKSLMDKCLINERLSMNGAMPDMQATDIRTLLQTAVERVQNETSQHRILFVPDGVPDEFTCDLFLMDILIGNLLENAVKYSPQGGTVTLRGWTGLQRELLLEVSDEGVGIPPEQTVRIFERFYRVGQVPGVTGAGLGLYLVRQIALLHAGDVTCSSSPGSGSTFTVTLPPVH